MSRTQTQTSPRDTQRQLRSQIVGLYEHAKRDADLLSRPGGQEFGTTLTRLDALSQQVTRPREQAEDSEVFNFMATHGAHMAKTLGMSTQARTPGDFIRALLQAYAACDEGADVAYEPESFRWTDLSKRLIGTKRAAPGPSCVLGTLSVQAKKRKATQRQPKQKLAAVQAPEQRQEDEQEDTETKDSQRIMRQIWDVLEQRQRVLLLPLILSHTSFAQTVENLFSFAFLVRDARVRLSDSPEGTVAEVHKGKEAARASDAAIKQAFVLSYTTADWEAWKEAVPAEDCLLAGVPDAAEAEALQQENQEPHRSSKQGKKQK